MKKVWLIILIVVVGTGLFFVSQHYNPKVTAPEVPLQGAQAISVSQSVEGSNLNQPGSYQVKEGQTALDLLKSTHTVVTKTFSGVAGEFVDVIDGNAPGTTRFWAFYVNGKLADVGAGSYVLKSGDQIQWKLEEIK